MRASSATEAEDAVQEAFVRALARPSHFRRLDNPEAWLRTVSVNQLRSRWRRLKRHGLIRHQLAVPEAAPAELAPDHVDLVAALRRLPAAQREVITLHHLGDLPVAEVAQTLGIPIGTAKTRLARGRAALAELRGRGRRLVRTRVIAAAFAVAIVAATGVTVATSALVDRSDPPIADVPLRDLTPEQIVQHPRAELQSFAVDANDPDVRAAVWQVPCASSNPDQVCELRRNALAVTDDGFATASYVGLADDHGLDIHDFSIEAVGDECFYLGQRYGLGRLVDTDGSATSVRLTERPSPVGADEVLLEAMLATRRGSYEQLALDVDAAHAHPIDLAPRFGYVHQNPDGTLWEFDNGDRVHWSTDGGATWSSRPVPLASGGGVEVDDIPSAANDILALSRSTEYIYPGEMARSTDNGRTWRAIDGSGPSAYWVVVRPDGSLLMQGDDERIYASAGTDWTTVRPVEPGLPSEATWEGLVGSVHVVDAISDDGAQALYVLGDTDQTVWTSTDGSHWEETPAR